MEYYLPFQAPKASFSPLRGEMPENYMQLGRNKHDDCNKEPEEST
jgi:hypothetical protein